MNRIIYHYPCPDGAYAAAAAYFAFLKQNLPVIFSPLTVYATPEEINAFASQVDNEEVVYMCDYTGPEGLILKIAEHAKEVVILDHHKTGFEYVEGLIAANALPNNIQAHFDMNRSGAVMALDYFKEKHGFTVTPDVEELYHYIQDHDLWKNEAPKSKEFSKGLGERNIEFNFNLNGDVFKTLHSLKVSELIEEGTKHIAEDQIAIDKELANTFVVTLPLDNAPFKALAVISELSKLRSEVGNQLALKSQEAGHLPIGVVAYREPAIADPSLIKVSFRSLGDTDTSALARSLGGGGHRNASSCIIQLDTFNSWKEEK